MHCHLQVKHKGTRWSRFLCSVTELSAALYMTSARYFYNAHEMELFHHDYTHTSGLLGLVKATSCILTVSLSARYNVMDFWY